MKKWIIIWTLGLIGQIGWNIEGTWFNTFVYEKIDKTPLTIYICEGEESEIKDWFRTINISGIELKPQEISNAVFSGPFVTAAKEEFSNSQNANIQKWSSYISGTVNRQDYLRIALEWVCKSRKTEDVELYMSMHRYDTSITELKAYFNSVIDWVSSTFIDVESEMRGLEWGRLYEEYHTTPYDPQEVHNKLQSLYEDFFIKNKKGCYEYILGGCSDTKLLEIRIFDETTKKTVYKKQTNKAEEKSANWCIDKIQNNTFRLLKLSNIMLIISSLAIKSIDAKGSSIIYNCPSIDNANAK